MEEVYLDNSATTMAYECVGDIVRKVMCKDYGNPSSMHAKGVEAEQYIKEAKEVLAKSLKVESKEIFFMKNVLITGAMSGIGLAAVKQFLNKERIRIIFKDIV